MMDNDSPQYWRKLVRWSALPWGLGYILFMVGITDYKNHPHYTVPESYCTNQDGTPCSPGIAAAMKQLDRDKEPARDQKDVGFGGVLMFLGGLLFIVGAIPSTLAGANLARIKREVLDYQYAKMQAERGNLNAVDAESTSHSTPPQDFVDNACPFCGENNLVNANFCSRCGRHM